MRRKETANSYNTITGEAIAEYIRGDAYMLLQEIEGGALERMSRAKAKRIAAALNKI